MKNYIIVYRFVLIILVTITTINTSFANNIVYETFTPDFFENVILDSMLMMDERAVMSISYKYADITKNSRFIQQNNTWIPGPSPKSVISRVINENRKDEIDFVVSSIVKPIVELSCSKNSDLLGSFRKKCIDDLLRYRIIDKIVINCDKFNKYNIDGIFDALTNSNNQKYEHVVCAISTIVNKLQTNNNKEIYSINRSIIKYPLPAAVGDKFFKELVEYKLQNSTEVSEEKKRLNDEYDKQRIQCTDANLSASNSACSKKLSRLRELRNTLESDVEGYIALRNSEEKNNKAINMRPAYNIDDDYKSNKKATDDNTGPIIGLSNGNAINTRTGEFLNKSGDVLVGSHDGTVYTKTNGGLINTKTGKFIPK